MIIEIYAMCTALLHCLHNITYMLLFSFPGKIWGSSERNGFLLEKKLFLPEKKLFLLEKNCFFWINLHTALVENVGLQPVEIADWMEVDKIITGA